MVAKLTTEIYVEKAKLVHGDVYDYSQTSYRGAREKLTVVCRRHGPFQVMASAHTVGKNGCIRCMGEQFKTDRSKSRDQFIADAKAVHGDRYDYSDVDYNGALTKVKITCKEHGVFMQRPDVHIEQGSGCRKCSRFGYHGSAPGYLYILQADDVTKVGITHKKPQTRCNEIKRSSKRSFEVVYARRFEDGSKALQLEQAALTYLRENYEDLGTSYDGSTESFFDVDVNTLLIKILNHEKTLDEDNVKGVQYEDSRST